MDHFFECIPSWPGRNPQFKVKISKGIGYIDINKTLFDELKPTAKIEVYHDGGGVWGDYEGAWSGLYLKSHIEVIEQLNNTLSNHKIELSQAADTRL